MAALSCCAQWYEKYSQVQTCTTNSGYSHERCERIIDAHRARAPDNLRFFLFI
jgi:hypothetical protein